MAVAQILAQAMKGNLTGESKEMEALEKVADIFETVAKRKAQEKKEKHNNEHAIRLPISTNAQSPRVADHNAQSSRVEEPPPRVDVILGLVIAWPIEAIVESSKKDLPNQDHRNYITQD